MRVIGPALLVGLLAALPASGAIQDAQGAHDFVVLHFTPTSAPGEAAAPMRLILLADEKAAEPRPVAQSAAAPAPQRDEPPAAEPEREIFDPRGMKLSLAGGMRQEDLRWNIANDLTGTTEPNVLSELTWSRVRLLTLDGRLEWPAWRGLGFALRAGAGFVVDGRNRDSDWLENDRQNEFSRSYADVKGHGALDLGLEASWRLGTSTTHLAPLVGYGWQSQEYDMRNGVLVIRPVRNEDDEIIGGAPARWKIGGLDSRYEHTWRGPYLGLAGRVGLGENWTLAGRVERHRSAYRAEATWNLREDLAQPVSFRQRGDGSGWRGEMELAWRRPNGLEFTLGINAKRFRLDDGRDEVYFSDDTQGQTRLNEVRWKSAGVSLGLRYAW